MGSSTVIVEIFTDAATFAGTTVGLVLLGIITLVAGLFAFRLGWKYFRKMVK